ncbi:glycosyl transferase [Pseudoalteromonas porphyrae]|uniref:glycosyltransferase n=1 Tax=Pseudoalteromonas TaxID=53246 RepID=UPI0006BAFDE3|nr:glycosyltransferase [Pseudoalteromonas porphyrae]KPH94922.1 glycosyl transferase [Pseudoalteromonas porphyrae]
MKVMHLVQHLKIGGLEKMAVTLLQKSRYSQSSIIVSLEGDKDTAIASWPELAELNPQIICLDKQPGFKLDVVNKLVELVEQYNINIIHSHHIGPMLYGGLACVSAKNNQLKHLSTVHDAWYLNNFKQRFITKALNSLSNVHWVADAKVVADDFHSKTAINTDSTILNGVDCCKFSSIDSDHARYEFSLPKFATLIGCSARLEEGKGHKDLIMSLLDLPSDYHLVFAGDGSLKSTLNALTLKMGLQERVHFLGNVQNMEVFYSSIDVMCLFSQREGLPLSILEAMACGKPIVASDVGGIHEVVTPEQGILVSASEPHNLAPALIKATTLISGMPIRNHVIALADAKGMSSQYDNLYAGLTV